MYDRNLNDEAFEVTRTREGDNMSLSRLATPWRYLIAGLLIVTMAAALALASVGWPEPKVPFAGVPSMDVDQQIDSTRLGKIAPEERARIALEPRNAGRNDVECIGECGP
jgi:hypothetical protein